MRRMSFLAAGILALMSAVPVMGQGQGTIKLGYIDSRAILDRAPGAQEAQQQWQAQMTQYQNEVQQMSEELQELIQQFQQQERTMTAETRSAREEEIRIKQGEYQTRVSQLEQQAAQRQAELVEPIMEKVNEVIEEIRIEGNYTMIFDVAAQAIISADPTWDLTQEVIRRLTIDAAPASGNP